MTPNGLWNEDVEIDFGDPTVEVRSLNVNNRLFVLSKRANEEDEDSQGEHRASDLQGACVAKHRPDTSL
jgi:hypothetical protein